jgi:hypothetical protein
MQRTPKLERILVASSDRSPRDGAAYRVAADSAEEITVDEATAVLGIVWGMANVGSVITNEETHFYEALIEYLAKRGNRDAVIDAAEQVKTLSGALEDLARLHAAALRRPSIREIAYKAAYMMRLWDLETNPKEEEFDAFLLEVLDLRTLGEELAGEVNALLMSPE